MHARGSKARTHTLNSVGRQDPVPRDLASELVVNKELATPRLGEVLGLANTKTTVHQIEPIDHTAAERDQSMDPSWP